MTKLHASAKNRTARDGSGNLNVLININQVEYDEDREIINSDFVGQTHYCGEEGELIATDNNIKNAVQEWAEGEYIQYDIIID